MLCQCSEQCTHAVLLIYVQFICWSCIPAITVDFDVDSVITAAIMLCYCIRLNSLRLETSLCLVGVQTTFIVVVDSDGLQKFNTQTQVFLVLWY